MKSRRRLKCYYCVSCGNVVYVKKKVKNCFICGGKMEEEDASYSYNGK